MDFSESKDLCLSLVNAESEDEVIKVLKDADFWDDSSAWRAYGDRSGNFSTIGNQQSRPEAALVEKIINSVDARLMNECLCAGIDPTSKKAPKTIRQAVAQFFEGRTIEAERGGLIRDWPPTRRTEESRKITVAATGTKRNPCLTVADMGEGQAPDRMPDTFLSIDRENKLRIPFVQGKFNMGGTGALKFCGRNRFQLVISKRNPVILEKFGKEDPSADLWGFTIVRRELPREGAGEVRNSVYKYLAPYQSDGPSKNPGVLRFKARSLPLLPEHNRPYVGDMEWGSMIKLYEYDMKGFSSHILMKDGLLFRLEILMPEIALPVRLHECRDFRGKTEASFSTPLSGLVTRLEDGRGGNLEEGFPVAVPFHVEGQDMVARIYAFQKGRAETYRTNEGVIFTINGQTHGSIPKSIFGRAKVKMHRLADSLLVAVDCSSISVDAREDLFMNSRDRLSSGHLRSAIERQLQDILANHPRLRALRERRREQEISDRLEDSKPLEDVLGSILKSSPSLASLFLKGKRLTSPHKRRGGTKDGTDGARDGDDPYVGKPHPTFFKFHKKKQGEALERDAEIGRHCRVKFDTDVVNDYFERTSMPGRYRVSLLTDGEDALTIPSNLVLHDGFGHWSLEIPEDSKVGDKIALECRVSDDVNPDGFTNNLILRVVPQSVKKKGKRKGERKSRTGGGGETGDEEPMGIELPNIKKVREQEWAGEGFDKFSACRVVEDAVESEEGEDRTVYSFSINVDNIYLRTEMKDSKPDVSLVEAKFVYGNVLVGLALIRDDMERRKRAKATDEDSLVNGEPSIYCC